MIQTKILFNTLQLTLLILSEPFWKADVDTLGIVEQEKWAEDIPPFFISFVLPNK